MKKVAFPREILSLASVGSAFMFFLFQSIVLLVFMLAFWHRPDWSALWLLIPALAAIVAFAAALAVFLSAVNVYLRDTQHLVEVGLMAWFWAIPGIYSYSGRVQQLLVKHRIFEIPGTHLIWLLLRQPGDPGRHDVPARLLQRRPSPLHYRHPGPGRKPVHLPVQVMATYGTHWYVLSDLAVLGVSLVMLFGALVVFGRLEGNFAEEL